MTKATQLSFRLDAGAARGATCRPSAQTAAKVHEHHFIYMLHLLYHFLSSALCVTPRELSCLSHVIGFHGRDRA